MANDDSPVITHLAVASLPEVRRELRKNFKWIAWLVVAIIVYVSAMGSVIRLFECKWTCLHSLYFTVINMTTVGFGDVVPETHGGKIIAGVNAFAGLVLFGLIVAVVSFALQPSSVSIDAVPSARFPPFEPTRAVSDFVELLNRALSRAHENEAVEVNVHRDAEIHVLVHHNKGHAHLHIDVFMKNDEASK